MVFRTTLLMLFLLSVCQSFADVPISTVKGKYELAKGYKLESNYGDYLQVKTKENGTDIYILCTPEGKEFFRSGDISNIVRYRKDYGGQTYTFVGSDDKYASMINPDGKEILKTDSYTKSITYIDKGGHRFFKVCNGVDSYLKDFLLFPDGRRLFEDNLIRNQSIEPVETERGLLFLIKTSQRLYDNKTMIAASLADTEGNILIPEARDGDIDIQTIGGKTYFSSYRPRPDDSNTIKTSYFTMFDASGKELPDVLKEYNSYIELDGHAFFILQKLRKGFGGKVEKGDCYVYSPDFDLNVPWTEDDSNLVIRGNSLAVANTSGKETLYALTSAKQPANRPTTAASPVASPASPERQIAQTAPTAASRVDVDTAIPQGSPRSTDTFVLIISNENYQEVAPVPHALNDGNVFEQYCTKTLGIPQKNIRHISDATLNQMRRQVNWLKDVAALSGDQASVIVYYSGHGIPSEENAEAFLVPADGYPADMRSNYPLSELYETLSSLPSRTVTLLLDACFTGALRGDGMMVAARGVSIKPKEAAPMGNLIVLTAAQGDQTAYPINDRKHGAFTYFLLKKLQQSKGKATLGEIGEYVEQEVMKWSLIENSKLQKPAVLTAPALVDRWKQVVL